MPTKTETDNKPEKPAEQHASFKDLKKGDRLSYTEYYIVTEVHRGHHRIDVTNERGMPITISGSIIDEGMYSATQFDPNNVQKVSRTELVDILANANGAILTVAFRKQVDEKSVSETVKAAAENVAVKDLVTSITKAVKDGLKGESRTLTGYVVSMEPKMGRCMVVDLAIPMDQHRLRLVDHRTLESLILRGIKYEVKK